MMEFKININENGTSINLQLNIESAHCNPVDLFAAITTLCTNFVRTDSNADYSVQLTSCGPHKIDAIKTIRLFQTIGLKEAKDLVEAPPCIVAKDISEAKANQMVGQLYSIGAVARAIKTKSLCML